MCKASNRKKQFSRAVRLAKRGVVELPIEEVRRWAAYHEAAHVICAREMGEEIDYVELRGVGGGFTHSVSPQWFVDLSGGTTGRRIDPAEVAALSAEQRAYIYGRLVNTVAGEVMERTLAPRYGYIMPQEEGAQTDVAQARSWAWLLAGAEASQEEAQAILNRAVGQANLILGWSADAVERLAAQLLAHGRLSGAQIGQCLGRPTQ